MKNEEILERFQRTIGIKRNDLIAKELGITKQSLSGFKQRGSLPLEALIDYCEKHGFDLNHIIYGKDPVEAINQELRLENERLKARLEEVRELLM